jgi:flagellar motor switch protein FliN/FliY
MDAPTLNAHIEEAQTALESFLTQLLNRDDIELAVDEAAESDADAAVVPLTTELAVGADNFALELPTGIVPLIGEAILGQPMEIDDEGADDLISEMTGQGYGAVRTQLAEAGLKLPEAQFTVSPPGDAGPDLPSDDLWTAAFTLTVGDETLKGTVFLNRDASAASADPEPAAQTAGTQQAAPQQQASPSAASAGAAQPAGSDGSEGAVDVAPAEFSDLGAETLGGASQRSRGNFEMLAEVELDVRVELGRRKLPLADVLQITSGSVIELEKLVGEPLSIYANGRFIAEGEAVVIDEKFGVRITKLAPKQQRSKALL